jgi:integrase
MKKAAEQESDMHFEIFCAAALELAPEVRARTRKTWSVFRELAEAWTSHELHRRWPDHVGAKRSWKDDKAKLDYLCELVVDVDGKRKLGDMPLVEITFDHANEAMRQLPEDCRRPSTRRQYAQCISRVLKLAVYPTGIISRSPLPPNFLPDVPEGDLIFPHFYPDEDLRLMRCPTLDYAERALFGLSNREGGRLGEFLRSLKWSGIDTRRFVIRLPGGTQRKNGKPGEWQAEPGSIEALEPLRELGGEGPFTHLLDDRKWANRLHAMMRTARLDREALYYSNVEEGFRRIRGHDCRATYLTLGIASGLPETHLMDRSGHTTSKMVHRYNRAAKALSASDSGTRLMPLDVALGLPMPPPRRSGWVTLDPRSPEAEMLERLARVTVSVPALLSGGSGSSREMSLSSSAFEEGSDPRGITVLDGELVDDEGDDGDRPGVARARAPAPEPLKRAIGGEMPRETKSGFVGSRNELSGKNEGLFDAVVRETGVEPARLAALEPKSVLRPSDDERAPVSPRNLVAEGEGEPIGVSPEVSQVRRPDTPPEPPADPVLAALSTAAHAAIERRDTATVQAIIAAMDRRCATLAGAAPKAAAPEAAPAPGVVA